MKGGCEWKQRGVMREREKKWEKDGEGVKKKDQ
jgi:hypothetical protein